MMDKRILILSSGTVACALGIGFFMQQSAAPRIYETPEISAASVQVPADPDLSELTIENITLTSVPHEDPAPQQAETVQAEAVVAKDDCALSVAANALPGAVVKLDVSAPCQAGKRLTVHHQGMMFTVALDDTGHLTQEVPALATSAVFIIEPQDGMAEVAVVPVPDLSEIDRVALQWTGNSGFEIHARENGADYGAPGHVWHGSDPASGMGHMVRLGDDSQLAPRLAEVYSFPRAAEQAGETVEISVEAEITAINCGRDVEAQALTLHRAGGQSKLQTRDLTLAIPDCAAKGDFLVLNNLLENLKIASN